MSFPVPIRARFARAAALGSWLAFSLPTLAHVAEAQGGATATLVIRNVSVVPMDSERVLANRTVLIEGDRITAVLEAEGAVVPAAAQVIDGQGKFLLPGLCDMHVHLTDPRDGLLYVANGVTTVRNLSGAPLHLDLAALYGRGTLIGPTLSTSGPQVRLGPAVKPEQAAAIVRAHHAQGYDEIKVYAGVSLENYRAMTAVSRELGIPLVGHIPRNLTLEEVLDVGGHREISHAEEMLYGFFNRNDLPRAEAIAACTELLVAAGVTVTPTLFVYADIENNVSDLESVLARPEMRYLPPFARALFGPALNKYVSFDDDDVRRMRSGAETLFELTGALHSAGVPLLVGTDAMNPSIAPGFSIHAELRALVTAGLSPYEALAAGTSAAARYLGAADQLGRVAPGQRADLLLCKGNPLEDVSHLRDIQAVVLRGRAYSAERLERLLEDQVAGYAAEAAALAGLDREDPAGLLELVEAGSEALGLPPDGFFTSLIAAYDLLGNAPAARTVADFGVVVHPDSILLSNQRAALLVAAGVPQEAGAQFESTLALDPENAVALRGLDELQR